MWDVAGEDFLEVGQVIAFALVAVETKVLRSDAEGTELLRQPDFGYRFAFPRFHPWAGGKTAVIQAIDDLAGEEALFVQHDEDQADIKEQCRGRRIFLRAGG